MKGDNFYSVCSEFVAFMQYYLVIKISFIYNRNVLRNDLKGRPFLYGCYLCYKNNFVPTVTYTCIYAYWRKTSHNKKSRFLKIDVWRC